MSMLSAKDLHGLEGLEPSVAIARLTKIRDGLATSNDPELLARLARAIPTRVSGLAPEVALLLADVAGLLVGYALTIPRDIDQLAEERLRVAWLRVALSSSDGEEQQLAEQQLAESLAEDTLLLTLTGWTWYASAAHPLPIFRRLAQASDPRLRTLLVERVEGAVVQHLALTGEQAFDCLAPLAAASESQVTIREGALRTLAKFWLVGLSPARARLRDDHIRAALRDPEPHIASAAIDAAYALGARSWLSDLLNEETGSSSSSSAVKARALDALGPIADPSDLEIALALADEDPLQFGPPVRRFLLEAHRHGVFLREPHHVDAVLRLFDTHLAWTGEELVRVTYIARAILVKKLAELPVDDARWIRRASILAASLKTGAHRVLEDLLDRIDPGDKSGWPIAAAVVDAAAASPELVAENGATEDRLLRFLDVLPEHVLPALRVKGGMAAAKKLRTIVLDPFTTRAMRTLAMDVLWALTDDRRSLLTELATTLPPHESGLLESKYLSARDSTAAELLEKSNERRTIPALDQLKIFCESGDVRFLAEVTRLFREVFRTYVRKALEGDFTIKRLLMPELEQLVFRYGRHLIKDGRSIRRFVDAGGGPETGRELVLLLVIDWLNDVAEPPSDPIVVALLETASRHAPDGAYLRFIEPFWRRGDANVRRAALEALVAAGPAGSRGLELSLGRLVAEANDPRILTQALAAVRTLRAVWAEPLVRNVLERREMAVKKEAAEALAEIGTGQSVASLVGWIGRHDNASFRTQLLRALDKSAGPAFVLVLVDALEKPDLEGRTRDLLLEALNNRLSIATVVRLATVGRAPEIVDACLEGRIAVQGATADEVAAQLYRAKLRPLEGEKKKDPTQRLRIEGFSAAAAQEVVKARMAAIPAGSMDGPILSIVRPMLADWISWALAEGAGGDVDANAVTLILDAATSSHAAEHLPLLLSLVEKWAPPRVGADGAAIVSFLERVLAHAHAHGPSVFPVPPSGVSSSLLPLRTRALAVVRQSLAPSPKVSGPRRWRLLGRLGAVRTLADLEACLSACDQAPNVGAESLVLLQEAFSIPTPSQDKAEREKHRELTELYEEAAALYRKDGAARARWLERVSKKRPIDLPPVPEPSFEVAKSPYKPTTQAELDQLLATLKDPEAPPQERTRAAVRIIEWPDVSWDPVREAYFKGEIELPLEKIATLVTKMTTWPNNAAVKERLLAIVIRLSDDQLRRFVPEWLREYEQEGSERAAELLRAIHQERLLPFVIERALQGSYTPVRLLRRAYFAVPLSSAAASLIALVAAKAPSEARHLLTPEKEETPIDLSVDPVDPIDGKSFDELVALLNTKGVEKGLAVRAVHALSRLGERSIDALARFSVDRRAQVRSAALRALRTVATKERTLEVTAQALKMETRRDVVLSLMASLGHGRHEPSLPGLLERLTDSDYRVRQGAHDALRAWGREIIPALLHAAKRARPDRREHYMTLINELS